MLSCVCAAVTIAALLIGTGSLAHASTIYWGTPSALNGWDTTTDTLAPSYKNTTTGWGVRIAQHPTNLDYIIWGSSTGLAVWDAVSNSPVGVFNNADSLNWANVPITSHPTDPTLILYGSTTGIRVWDTVSDVDAGVYGNATGDWSSTGIALLPSDPTRIVYTAGAGGLDVWDTLANTNAGDFENAVASWGTSIGIEFLGVPVPEPGTGLLLGTGLLCLAARNSRRCRGQ